MKRFYLIRLLVVLVVAVLVLLGISSCNTNPVIVPSESTAPSVETTAEPDETTVGPSETTAVPDETTVEPDETTAEPDETTAEPSETTAEPDETTAEPDETTAEPDETTAELDETTAEPDETTAEPDETTAEPETTACAHEYEAEVTPPTCTVDGYTTYTCSGCGDSYTADEIPASHSYVADVTNPSCTSDGYTTYVCPECGDNYVSDRVVAPGHSYEAVVTPPSCTSDGYTTYVCSECGDNYVSDRIAAPGHSYEAVVTPPTCTEGGYTTHICSCGDTVVDSYVQANGHTFVEGVCTACGLSKKPWDESRDIVTVQNVDFIFADDYQDQKFIYSGSFDQWNKVANVTDSTVHSLTYWGWIGIAADTVGSFGYSIDGGTPIYDAGFTVAVDNEVVLAAAQGMNPATKHALNCGIVINVANVIGTHTIDVLYQDVDGNVAILCTFTVVKSDPNAWTVTLAQYDGVGDAENGWKIHNEYGAQPFGQKFDIGECILKQIIINNLANFDEPVNAWTVKIWAWNTSYAATVAGSPLYEVSGENWLGNNDFIISIPDGVEITGEIYYEISYTGAQAFTGWIGSDPVEGLVTYVNGGLVATYHYAASIGVIIPEAPETETETTPGPTQDQQTFVLSEYVGNGNPPGANVHNLLGAVPLGQKFDIGNYALKKLTISKLATYATSTNSWTIKFWQWNDTYAKTTYSEPIYEKSGTNHRDSQDFVVNIPNGIVLTGEIYYELYYTGGSASFTGWIGGNSASGLVTYLNGTPCANHYASSVYVVRMNNSGSGTETETDPGVEIETEPDYGGPSVSVNYPSSTLPDYGQYTTDARIQTVLGNRKTWAIATGSSAQKYYVSGVLTENGNNLGYTTTGGTVVLNPSKLSELFGVELTGSTPLAIAAELGMSVMVYDSKLVLFYEGELPFHTYDDMYTLEAMYLYMTNASETEIVNAFIDLPSRISNNTSNTVFYTAADLNLGVQTSIYFAQMGQSNGLLVGPSMVVGEGKHADNFTTVRIFNNQQICITQFLAFDASVKGGVQVAAAQVGGETLIATAAFAQHAGTNGDIRVFDAFGLLRMTINVRDIISGPYTIATGHFAEGVKNEVLLIASQTTDGQGRLPYVLVSLATGQVISQNTLDCSFAGANTPVAVTVRNNGYADSVILYFNSIQAVYEGNAQTAQFQNAGLTLPAEAVGVTPSNVTGQKYTVALATTVGTENQSFLTVYGENASATKVDVGFRENRFFFWAADGTLLNSIGGSMNDDKYVAWGMFAHVRTDNQSNSVVNRLGGLNSAQIDDLFDSAKYEDYASTASGTYLTALKTQYVFLEPCFTHRWHANYTSMQALYNYRDPETGAMKYLSQNASGVHKGYGETSDYGTDSFYVGTYADGILELAKLRIYPLRSFLQDTALAFRGYGANPEHLVGVSPVHEQEIHVEGSAGDHNPYMVEGFRGYLLDRYGSVENINSTFGTTFANRDAIDAPRKQGRGTWDNFSGSYFQEWVLYNRYVVSKRIMEAYREALLAGYPPESISAHSIPEEAVSNTTLSHTNTNQNFRLTPTDVVLSCGTAYGGTRYGNTSTNSNMVINAHNMGHSNITLGEYCANASKAWYESQDDVNRRVYNVLKSYWNNGLRYAHIITVSSSYQPAEIYAFQTLMSENKPRPGYTGGTTNTVTVGVAGKQYNIVQIGAGANSSSTGLLKSIDTTGKWEGTVYLVPFHTKVNSTEITGLSAPVSGTQNQFSTGTLATMKNTDQAEITFNARKTSAARAWVEISVYHQGYLLEDSTTVYELTSTMSAYRYVLSNQLYESGLEVRITFHTEDGDGSMASIILENLYGTLQTEKANYAYYGQNVADNEAHKGGVTFDLLDRDMLG